MSTEGDHFLVIVGDICNAARLAKLPVRVTTRDGQSVLGVPEAELARIEDAREVDHTGYTNHLVVGGVTIHLDQVVELRVASPDADEAEATNARE